MKLMTGPGAFQGVVGFWGGGGVGDRFSHAGGVAGSLDYLLEMPTIASNAYFNVAWSFGVGAGVGVPTTNSSLGAAVSGVAGLEFNFMVVPIDFVVELRPASPSPPTSACTWSTSRPACVCGCSRRRARRQCRLKY